MTEPRSALAGWQQRAPADAQEMVALRRAAWRKQGIAVIRVADISDARARQAVIDEANRLYGRREVEQ